MKKILGGILALSLTTGIISCSEDFNIAAPYKEITVSYGLLNMVDTAHYIRIQKAFLDESKSALEMAKDADSSFYSSLDVRIREININNAVVGETVLTRVDLGTEGYPKEQGAFFNTPHYAYKYKHTLNPANRYRLVIKNTVSGKTDSAETSIISSNPADDPTDFTVFEFRQTAFRMNFVNAGRPNGQFAINLRAPANGRLYEGIIRFHWVDKNINTDEEKRHSVDWTFVTGDYTADGFSMSVEQSKFFPFLINAMQPAAAGIERYIDSCDMFVWAATEEVYTYRQYQMASGGLTGDQIKPNYTNFKGEDVLGLFASRAVRSRLQIPFSEATLDSLRLHPDVLPLKIRDVADH